MSTPKHSPLVRLLPSFTDLAILMPFVFLFVRMDGMRGLLGDGDTGWHIRAGEWILANGAIPRQDIFSYTMPDRPWYAWEWLWDVAFAWVHLHWGLPAVVLGSLAVISLTFGLLFRSVNTLCGNPLVAFGLTFLAAAASTIHWLARPHLFTMLFLVLSMNLIQSARERNLKLLLWFPAGMILWANVHGGFLAGVILLAAYAAGDLASAVLAPNEDERRKFTRLAAWFAGAAVASLCASLVNPYGYQLHVHIWDYLTNPEMTRSIVEFQGTNFQNGASGYFEALLVIGAGAAIWHGRQGHFAEVAALILWGHMALLMARNIPLFALISVPLLAPAVVAWVHALQNAPVAGWVRAAMREVSDIAQEFAGIERMPRIHLATAAAFVLAAVIMQAPDPGRLWKAEYDTKSYPSAALAALNSTQRVFTNDEWGDYLIYRMSPSGLKVYVDGRSDFYGSKFDKEYIELIRGRYDWEQTLARYSVDTVLLPPDSGLATTIKESIHWRVTYDDGTAIVFQRREPSGTEQVSTPQGGGGGTGQAAGTQSVTSKSHAAGMGVKPL